MGLFFQIFMIYALWFSLMLAIERQIIKEYFLKDFLLAILLRTVALYAITALYGWIWGTDYPETLAAVVIGISLLWILIGIVVQYISDLFDFAIWIKNETKFYLRVGMLFSMALYTYAWLKTTGLV